MISKAQLSDHLSISKIVAGFMNTGMWGLKDQELMSYIKSCMELGITTMDHADIYGGYTCEALFGKALATNPTTREKMQIITKCGIALVTDNRPKHHIKHYDTSKEHILLSVENSLRALQTDRIDLLLIHRPDPLMLYDEIAAAFDQLRKEGKVLNFGVSNFTPQQFTTLQSYCDQPLVTNQIEIHCGHTAPFLDGSLDFLQEKQIKPMAWSPLGGGAVFGDSDDPGVVRLQTALNKVLVESEAKSIDQVMLAWLFKHPSGIIPVLGTGKIKRLESAVEALEVTISRQQWFEIYTAALGQPVP